MTISACLAVLALIHLAAAVYFGVVARCYRAPWLRRRIQRRAERFGCAAFVMGLLCALVTR